MRGGGGGITPGGVRGNEVPVAYSAKIRHLEIHVMMYRGLPFSTCARIKWTAPYWYICDSAHGKDALCGNAPLKRGPLSFNTL